MDLELGCFSSDFDTANASLFLGRARMGRWFDPYLPTVGNETWRDALTIVRPFWSCKAPATSGGDGRDWAGAIAGDYDAQYAALFAAFPAYGRLTVGHEPEDNMTSAQFRALTERLVPIFRANAPSGAEYWTVADHWQWDSAHSSYAHYQDATDAANVKALMSIVDGAACDVYASSSRGMVSLASEPGFQRWLDEVGQYAPAIGVTERGITAETATTRADLLIQDAADCVALDADPDLPPFKFYSYWQATGPAGNDEITDGTCKREMRMWAAALSG